MLLQYHLFVEGENDLQFYTKVDAIDFNRWKFKDLLCNIIVDSRTNPQIIDHFRKNINHQNPGHSIKMQYLQNEFHPLLTIKLCQALPTNYTKNINKYVEEIVNDTKTSSISLNAMCNKYNLEQQCLWIILMKDIRPNCIINMGHIQEPFLLVSNEIPKLEKDYPCTTKL